MVLLHVLQDLELKTGEYSYTIALTPDGVYDVASLGFREL
jgi:hypothetical protein